MASRQTQIIQAMLVALSVAFTVFTFTSVKSTLKEHYHSVPTVHIYPRFLQGAKYLIQETNDGSTNTTSTEPQTPPKPQETYHNFISFIQFENQAIKDYGFRKQLFGWNTDSSLGNILKDSRVCEFMDCNNLGGTATGHFKYDVNGKISTEKVEMLLNLYNGKYRNEMLELTMDIQRLPDCETKDDQDCLYKEEEIGSTNVWSFSVKNNDLVKLSFKSDNLEHFQIKQLEYESFKFELRVQDTTRWLNLDLRNADNSYLKVNIDHQKFYSNIFFKSLTFSGFYSFIMAMVLVHSGKQLLEAENQEALGEKVSYFEIAQISIISLCIHAFWDLMAGMVFSTESSYYQNSTIPLLIPALMHFVIFVYADLRLLAVAWIHRQRRMNNDPNVIRSNCLKFFLYFYLLLIISVNFLGSFILRNPPLALVLYTPLWLPQIISNIFSGAKRVPKLGYVYFFSLMRIYPFLYITLCPENLLQLRPNKTYGYTGLSLIIGQVILLHIQYVLGGRFLIPKRCRPGYFQYEKHFLPADLQNVEGALGHNECIICMQKLMYLPEDHGHHSSNENIIEESEGNKQRAHCYMQTPCTHRYHKKCLTHWLEMREECPICRSKIPPIM